MSIRPQNRAQQEAALLVGIAADDNREPAERAHALLIAHQRRDVGGCLCGWSELGKSHARHQTDELAHAGLLVTPAAHRARLAEGTETA